MSNNDDDDEDKRREEKKRYSGNPLPFFYGRAPPTTAVTHAKRQFNRLCNKPSTTTVIGEKKKLFFFLLGMSILVTGHSPKSSITKFGCRAEFRQNKKRKINIPDEAERRKLFLEKKKPKNLIKSRRKKIFWGRRVVRAKRFIRPGPRVYRCWNQTGTNHAQHRITKKKTTSKNQ